MTKRIKVILAIAAELVIAAFSLQYCWIVKWPPNGPIRLFTPGLALLVFTILSGVLWILIGIFRVATREERTSLALNLRDQDSEQH